MNCDAYSQTKMVRDVAQGVRCGVQGTRSFRYPIYVVVVCTLCIYKLAIK